MSITPIDYPEVTLNPGQGELVVQALCEAIDSIPEGEELPRFEQYRTDQGILWVTCSDTKALTWLKSTVPTLVPWEGASLQLLERGQLPKLTRMMTFITGPPAATDVILTRLRRQNPGLLTHLWRVWGRNDGPESVHLVVGVDAKSCEVIRNGGHKAHYCLGRIFFKEGHQKAEREPATPGPDSSYVERPQESALGPATDPGHQPDTQQRTAGEDAAAQDLSGSGTQGESSGKQGKTGPSRGRGGHPQRSRGRPYRAMETSRAGQESVRAGVQRTLHCSLSAPDTPQRGLQNKGPPADTGDGGNC